jgi:Ca2+-binding RTX toxin-like protein
MTRISTSGQAAATAASSIFLNPAVAITLNEESVGSVGLGQSSTFASTSENVTTYFATISLVGTVAYDFIAQAVSNVDYDIAIFDSEGYQLQVAYDPINSSFQSSDDNTEINGFTPDTDGVYYIQVTVDHTAVSSYDFTLNITQDVAGEDNPINNVVGTGGDDTLSGGTGTDSVDGGEGNDTVAGGSGSDTVVGGAGNDVISGDSGSGGSSGGSSSAGGGGGSGGGSVSTSSGGGGGVGAGATAGATVVDGNDLIYGGIGDDEIYGNGGNDTIYGDDGNDILDGGTGIDQVRGLNGNDYILLGSGDDAFANGNKGEDTIYGGLGNDFRILGGQDTDLIHGDDGNDFVNGNKGNDSVYGDNGDDTVHGGTAQDMLFGLAGNDFMYGDLGNDTMAGGSGADTFVFSTDSGVDVITDFTLGTDKIQVKSTVLATAADVVAGFSGGVLNLGDGNQVTINSLGSLSESDIIIF